jgi:hypothetical protein
VQALGQLVDREFVRFYLDRALARTRAELARRDRAIYLEVLLEKASDLEDGISHEELARRHGLSVFDVRNYIFAARKVFRKQLRKLAAELSTDPASELRELGLPAGE